MPGKETAHNKTLNEKPEVLDKLYDRTRKQIEHEDGLINHRITWLLASQGFLFFAYSQVSTAVAKPTHVTTTLLLISALGIAITISIFLSIVAAFNSLKNLRGKWSNACKDIVGDDSPDHLTSLGYPQITWVGKSWMRAISSAGGLPYFFVIIWSARIVLDLPETFSKGIVGLLTVLVLWLMYREIRNARGQDYE